MKILPVAIAMLCLALSGCVPNKKLVIAQDKTLKKPQDQEYVHRLPNNTPDCLLEPGDVIAVRITHVDLLNENYQQASIDNYSKPGASNNPDGYEVSEAGSIHLSILGEVAVGGMTLNDAERAIEKASENVYSKPSVKVSLLNTEVTILGEILRPGTYPTSQCSKGLFDIIGLAGGTTTMADLESVKVIRSRGDSTEVYFVDLSNELLLSQANYHALPGDVVYIKPLKRKQFVLQESGEIFRGLGVVLSVASLLIAISKI